MVPLVKISLWDYKSIAKQLVFLKATSRSQNRRVTDAQWFGKAKNQDVSTKLLARGKVYNLMSQFHIVLNHSVMMVEVVKDFEDVKRPRGERVKVSVGEKSR